jgi:(2Fe-2S) ferredoxin
MKTVLVCQYVNCVANGSAPVLAEFVAAVSGVDGPGVEVLASECQGQCNMGPTVRVLPDEIWYCRVRPGDVGAIVQEHLRNSTPVIRLLHPRLHPPGSI